MIHRQISEKFERKHNNFTIERKKYETNSLHYALSLKVSMNGLIALTVFSALITRAGH